MTLFLIFLCFNGALAFKYSIFEYQNISTLLPENNCPPLYYGENCTIPYCCPETSHLVKRGDNDFYCNCTADTTGTHCEIVNCHRGELSKLTFKCECEIGMFGAHCDKQVMELVCAVAFMFLFFLSFILAKEWEDEDNESVQFGGENSLNQNRAYWSRAPHPAPEIRIVERVVIQERSDAPPTYDTAVRSADPPKYTV